MICEKCGKEVDGNFCKHCGIEIPTKSSNTQGSGSGTEPVSTQQQSVEPTKSASDIKIKIVSYLIAIALFIAVFFGIWHFLSGGTSAAEETHPTFVENMTAAEMAIDDYVTYPSTLEFSYYEDDWKFVSNNNKRVKMESFFECENAFGVTETHEFVLIVTYSDDYENFTINSLTIDKESFV